MSKPSKRLIENGRKGIANPEGLRTQLGLDIEEAFLEFAAGQRGEVELVQYEIDDPNSASPTAPASDRSPPAGRA